MISNRNKKQQTTYEISSTKTRARLTDQNGTRTIVQSCGDGILQPMKATSMIGKQPGRPNVKNKDAKQKKKNNRTANKLLIVSDRPLTLQHKKIKKPKKLTSINPSNTQHQYTE